MKKTLYAILVFALALALTACAATGSGGEQRVLRVGVRTNVVNFGYQSPDSGRFYGLEIDLANELAKRLGYTAAQYAAVATENREQLLESGAVDCLIATYTITPERVEQFDFSEPYYTDAIKVVAEDSTGFSSIKSLRGALVGVRRDTTAALELCREMAVQKLIPSFDEAAFEAETFSDGLAFVVFDSYEALSEAVECGQVDAACMDGSISKGYMSGSRLYLSETFAPQAYGVATRKGDALSRPIADAVNAMLEDGTLDRLTEKWN